MPQRLVPPGRARAGIDAADVLDDVGLGGRAFDLDRLAVLKIGHMIYLRMDKKCAEVAQGLGVGTPSGREAAVQLTEGSRRTLRPPWHQALAGYRSRLVGSQAAAGGPGPEPLNCLAGGPGNRNNVLGGFHQGDTQKSR